MRMQGPPAYIPDDTGPTAEVWTPPTPLPWWVRHVEWATLLAAGVIFGVIAGLWSICAMLFATP